MSESWSREEVEAIVADYFAMLTNDLRHEPYNKTEHRRNLIRLLRGRSAGSVERKHQNVSAALNELRFPYISGYKPLRNYQRLLFDVVADRLAGERDLASLVSRQVEDPAKVPVIDDILKALVPPPPPAAPVLSGKVKRSDSFAASARARRTDYLARESRNRSLGAAGEEFVLHFERARLHRAGKDHLADRVEQVSETRGDGLGFDVLSYETNGRDRLIEVKTTAYAIETPFYITGNELYVSQEHSDHYHLYRVFEFRGSPKLFAMRGALDAVCTLQPIEYLGNVR